MGCFDDIRVIAIVAIVAIVAVAVLAMGIMFCNTMRPKACDRPAYQYQDHAVRDTEIERELQQRDANAAVNFSGIAPPINQDVVLRL